MNAVIRLFTVLILYAVFTIPASAQTTGTPDQPSQPSGEPIKVVTRVLPPMVVDDQGELTGFSIDLWNEIARRLNIKTAFHTAPDIRSLLSDVR
ncbi:MAG: transporter substrate-binding domain-containing protein, partial [Hyphomicrobiaceae bacterium]